MDKKRPNIVWVSFEDTNPRYGCYGDPIARSPNVDRLAAEGCIYKNAFSVAGVCAPSRSAIITGVYPQWAGTQHMRTTHRNRNTPEMPTGYSAVIPPHVKCFPEYLRAAGYFCTNNLKTDYQFTPPLTAWDECGDQAHWRNRRDPEQPFFAVFNPTFTHESGMWSEKDPERELKTDPFAVEVPPYLPDTDEVRQAIARQYDNIERDDEVLGRVLAELEADGLLENTIIFHWSDHGEGLPRGKRWVYDRGIHIPLIVRCPDFLGAGIETDEVVSLIDLGPTVLSLCGVEIPAHMQGQPFIGPSAREERKVAFAGRDRMDEYYMRLRAARDNRFKYIRNYHPDRALLGWIPYRNHHDAMQALWKAYVDGNLTREQEVLFQDTPVEELYDTENDPWELNNLARNPEYADTLDRLRKEVDAWVEKFDRYGDISEEIMVNQWYPGGEQPKTGVPIFVPIHEAMDRGEPENDGGTLDGPVRLQLHSATQGASIAYTFEEGDDAHWLLYSHPIELEQGEHTIRAKAIRIGYAESDQRSATFSVE